MGAVLNMAPELYKGFHAAVPFVDVVTTMLDEDIPLTSGEWDEWGNPNEKEFYDNVAKWVAKLREYKTDMAAGHGGTTGRFRRLEDTALYYAFFVGLEGIRE
jgi:oligopeptidase B